MKLICYHEIVNVNVLKHLSAVIYFLIKNIFILHSNELHTMVGK